MLSTLDFPQNQVSSPRPEQATATWCCVSTFTGFESAVERRLVGQGIECYYPVERIRRVQRGKSVTIDRSLYPSYLFAQFADEWQRHDIRRTRYVADLLLAHDPERLAKQIESLRSVLRQNPFADATDWCNDVGRRVVVSRGPFQNNEGYIIKRERKVRDRTVIKDILCVGVLMLGRVVEVEIDPAYCEPI